MSISHLPCLVSMPEIAPMEAVRIKITSRCQFTCHFCHQEGAAGTEDILPDEQFGSLLRRLRDELHLKEAHLTGGEPTAGKCLEIVSRLSYLGYQVKMTSNGQFSSSMLRNLQLAGLKGINFSIHTLHPERLAKLQHPPRSVCWGQAAIDRVLANARQAEALGLSVKLNAVVGRDATDALELIRFAEQEHLPLRLLNDLSLGSVATETIESVIAKLGGKVHRVSLTEGLSSYSYDVASENGLNFGVKAITKTALSSLCSDCRVRDACQEWFYGIRIERQRGELRIRLCLYRHDPVALPLAEHFFDTPQYREIASLARHTE